MDPRMGSTYIDNPISPRTLKATQFKKTRCAVYRHRDPDYRKTFNENSKLYLPAPAFLPAHVNNLVLKITLFLNLY